MKIKNSICIVLFLLFSVIFSTSLFAADNLFYLNWGANEEDVKLWQGSQGQNEPKINRFKNGSTIIYDIILLGREAFVVYEFFNNRLIGSVVSTQRIEAYDENGNPTYEEFVNKIKEHIFNQMNNPLYISVPIKQGEEPGIIKFIDGPTYVFMSYYSSWQEDFKDVNIFMLSIYCFDAQRSPYIDMEKVKLEFE